MNKAAFVLFMLLLTSAQAEQVIAGAGRGDARLHLAGITAAAAPEKQTQPGPEPTKAGVRFRESMATPPAPKLSPVGTPPISGQPIEVDVAINPLTGRSFSEERLDRLLVANKKVTQIIKEQVEQARHQAELAGLGADQGQIASAKRRSDVINVIPAPSPAARGSEIAPSESLGRGEMLLKSMAEGQQGTPSAAPVVAPLMPVAPASGSIKIGAQSIQATQKPSSDVAVVNFVDSQPSIAKSSAGAPAGGGFYPGFTPAVMPAGVSIQSTR